MYALLCPLLDTRCPPRASVPGIAPLAQAVCHGTETYGLPDVHAPPVRLHIADRAARQPRRLLGGLVGLTTLDLRGCRSLATLPDSLLVIYTDVQRRRTETVDPGQAWRWGAWR